MSTNKTTNYQLNQWEPTDDFLRTDFNEDNARIDAALAELAGGIPKIATGSYNGSSVTTRTLTFGFPAKFVMVLRADNNTPFSGIFVRPATVGMARFDTGNYTVNLTWSDTGVSWNSSGGDSALNGSGVKYYWFAIG